MSQTFMRLSLAQRFITRIICSTCELAVFRSSCITSVSSSLQQQQGQQFKKMLILTALNVIFVQTRMLHVPELHTGKGKDKVRPRTGHEGTEGEQRYSSTVSLNPVLHVSGWSTPRPSRFTPRKRPNTHCIGGWVGPMAGLDGYEKFRPYRDSIPRPSSLH